MARDIEEFLRRAAERRKQQGQKKQQAAAPPPRQRSVTPPAQPRRLVIADDEVEVVRPRLVEKDMRDESVAAHVQRHINTSEIADHVTHLSDRIEQTDERLEARLHKKFDHRVGTLDSKPSVQDDVVPVVKGEDISGLAKDLVEMLNSPKSVRQAILIAEVLKRPDFD